MILDELFAQGLSSPPPQGLERCSLALTAISPLICSRADTRFPELGSNEGTEITVGKSNVSMHIEVELLHACPFPETVALIAWLL